MDEEFTVTYIVALGMQIPDYARICSLLKDDLEKELKKEYTEVKFLNKCNDLDEFSVSFDIQGTRNKLKEVKLKEDGTEYIFKLSNPQNLNTSQNSLKQIVDLYFGKLEQFAVPFSELSITLIEEAMRSFQNEIYDGTVILCRSLIDSSLYLACAYKRVIKQTGKTGFTQALPQSFIKKGGEIKNISWCNLKKETIKIFPDLSSEIDYINNQVRQLGNFAAHFAKNEINERIKWFTKNEAALKGELVGILTGKNKATHPIPGLKIRTSSNEAGYALKLTICFLIDLVDNYNSVYK